MNGGRRASEAKKYHNKRVEMWANLRDAMKGPIDIPKDNTLMDQLIGPEYLFDSTNRQQLERKEDMKKRGLSSPDWGDALAMTYAQEVEGS